MSGKAPVVNRGTVGLAGSRYDHLDLGYKLTSDVTSRGFTVLSRAVLVATTSGIALVGTGQFGRARVSQMRSITKRRARRVELHGTARLSSVAIGKYPIQFRVWWRRGVATWIVVGR